MKNNTKNFIPMINEKGAEIVFDLINEHEIKTTNIHIRFEEDETKYITGIFGKIDSDLKNHFKYNHFIESINDLSKKTKMSIELCVKTYQEIDMANFNPMNNNLSKLENIAYYYLENALFREIVLWDSLAQLYNIYVGLNLDVKDIKYHKFFNKVKKDFPAAININSIVDYICEEEVRGNIEKGVHHYICKVRHQFTHRFSIAITSMSENHNLRSMPDLIYRIAIDYNKVQKYLIDILNVILKNQYNKLNNKEI